MLPEASDLFIADFIAPETYRKILDKEMPGWRDWEPETLRQEITRVFSARPTEQVFEKIMALQTFLTTELFWDNVMLFEDMILAFGDRFVDPTLLQVCLPEELAYGMVVANEILHGREVEFVRDIIEYVRACHREAGVLVYHDVLKFAEPDREGDLAEIADAARDPVSYTHLTLPTN